MIGRIEGMEKSKNEYQCKDRKSEVKLNNTREDDLK